MTPSLTSLDSTAKRILGAEMLGWKLELFDKPWTDNCTITRPTGETSRPSDPRRSPTSLLPAFDTDLNAAITLAEQLAKDGWDFEAVRDVGMKYYNVSFEKSESWHKASGDSLALAILNAALLAAGKAVL